MEDTTRNLITTIRKKYNLLLFIVLTTMPLFLWTLIIILNYFNGVIFSDPKKLSTELFVAFAFPLIIAPIFSGLTLLIAKSIRIRILRWVVIVGLGVIIPLIAFLLVFIAHFITRKIYIGNKEYLPSILFMMTNSSKKRENKDFGGELKYDLQEDNPLIKAKIDEAVLEAEKNLADTPRGRGFCHSLWREQKHILKEKYNIDWKTPSEMNPRILFD